MAANTQPATSALPPPRSETGVVGWVRGNLFSSWFNSILTILVGAAIITGAWFALAWVFAGAEWGVISTIGGRFLIGNYNSDQICPGNDCLWRPQASLLIVTVLLGIGWGMVGGGVIRRIAVMVAVVAALFSLLPYSMERMGMDVRLMLAANLPALALGWALGRYTPLGAPRRLVVLSVLSFLFILLLLNGLPGTPGLQASEVRSWVGVLLAVLIGLILGLPVGAALAMGQHFRLPAVRRMRLAANLGSLGLTWAVDRYTPLGKPLWMAAVCVVVLLLVLLLMYGIPSIPGMSPVDVRNWGGLQLNLLLAVSGIVFSLPIGIALALGRRSSLPLVRLLCVLFIEVFRGVPLITLLFMSQHLVPLAFPETFPRNSLLNAGIVITLFSSAYMAENVRGGLQALHPGQAEAARALGLPGWQTTLLISLPQAIRNVIPAIVGQFIGLFKDTSLVYIIGMLDMVEVGRVAVVGRPEFQGNVHEVFVFLALVFWVFTYGMSYVSRKVEQRLGVGER